MFQGVNSLPKIQINEQSWKNNSQPPVIASIKVGDVKESSQLVAPETKNNFWQKLRNYFVNKRLKKLAAIPPEKRTASQSAEIEANKKSVNYML